MYEHNENQTGFWIQRNSWGNTVAKVITIGKRTSGKLKGRAPYYGNPNVLVEMYKISTWERLQGGEEEGRTLLSCPGTYKYSMVEVVEPNNNSETKEE
tara:strand:- start:46 stop:339 length:294 start_codon:yes stop_codon:yes gene_type:complete